MAEPFVNPYTALVLRETERVRGLENEPVGPMFSPEELERRRQEAQQKYAWAVLGSLSGDKMIHSAGSALLSDALQAQRERITEHGVYNPVEARLTQFPESKRERELNKARDERQRLERKEADAEMRERARQLQEEFRGPLVSAQAELARTKAEKLALETAQGKPLPTKEAATLRALGDVDMNLNVVKDRVTKGYTQNTGISPVERGLDILSEFAPGLTKEYAPSISENRDVWAEVQRLLEMPERHKTFGATLTAGEQAAWKSVTPPRGWDRGQLLNWIQERHDILNAAMARNIEAAVAAGYNKKQIEGLTGRPLTVPPVAPPTAPPPAAAPAAPPPFGGTAPFMFNRDTGQITPRT